MHENFEPLKRHIMNAEISSCHQILHGPGVFKEHAMRSFSTLFAVLLLGAATSSVLPTRSQPAEVKELAFPGAEGFGAYARGGRGGQTLTVTTLADYVPGREAVIPGSLR